MFDRNNFSKKFVQDKFFAVKQDNIEYTPPFPVPNSLADFEAFLNSDNYEAFKTGTKALIDRYQKESTKLGLDTEYVQVSLNRLLALLRYSYSKNDDEANREAFVFFTTGIFYISELIRLIENNMGGSNSRNELNNMYKGLNVCRGGALKNIKDVLANMNRDPGFILMRIREKQCDDIVSAVIAEFDGALYQIPKARIIHYACQFSNMIADQYGINQIVDARIASNDPELFAKISELALPELYKNVTPLSIVEGMLENIMADFSYFKKHYEASSDPRAKTIHVDDFSKTLKKFGADEKFSSSDYLVDNDLTLLKDEAIIPQLKISLAIRLCESGYFDKSTNRQIKDNNITFNFITSDLDLCYVTDVYGVRTPCKNYITGLLKSHQLSTLSPEILNQIDLADKLRFALSLEAQDRDYFLKYFELDDITQLDIDSISIEALTYYIHLNLDILQNKQVMNRVSKNLYSILRQSSEIQCLEILTALERVDDSTWKQMYEKARTLIMVLNSVPRGQKLPTYINTTIFEMHLKSARYIADLIYALSISGLKTFFTNLRPDIIANCVKTDEDLFALVSKLDSKLSGHPEMMDMFEVFFSFLSTELISQIELVSLLKYPKSFFDFLMAKEDFRSMIQNKITVMGIEKFSDAYLPNHWCTFANCIQKLNKTFLENLINTPEKLATFINLNKHIVIQTLSKALGLDYFQKHITTDNFINFIAKLHCHEDRVTLLEQLSEISALENIQLTRKSLRQLLRLIPDQDINAVLTVFANQIQIIATKEDFKYIIAKSQNIISSNLISANENSGHLVNIFGHKIANMYKDIDDLKNDLNKGALKGKTHLISAVIATFSSYLPSKTAIATSVSKQSFFNTSGRKRKRTEVEDLKKSAASVKFSKSLN